MTEPFIFVTTHALNEGELEAYMAQNREFLAFLEANEPRLLDFRVYMNQDQTEVTFVFVFPDADAADAHFRVAQDYIARGLQITTTARLEVYGAPGPLLQQALDGNAQLGVPVSVKPNHLGGFSRAATTTA